MERTEGRLVFRIGDAFPAGEPVARFIVAMATALNDLLTASKAIVGGDESEPYRREISDVEGLYQLRLSFAQLHELRETVKHARKDAAVGAFIATLPDTAKEDLRQLITINTRKAQWIRKTMEYVRNQTNHYGGRWGWEELDWAMKQVAASEGEIEMRSPKVAGMRLRFADEVAAQYLTRHFPEYGEDPDAEVDDATLQAHLRVLFEAMASAVSAAQNFAVAALVAYIDTLPPGVVRREFS